MARGTMLRHFVRHFQLQPDKPKQSLHIPLVPLTFADTFFIFCEWQLMKLHRQHCTVGFHQLLTLAPPLSGRYARQPLHL